jgi:hypothetical protein
MQPVERLLTVSPLPSACNPHWSWQSHRRSSSFPARRRLAERCLTLFKLEYSFEIVQTAVREPWQYRTCCLSPCVAVFFMVPRRPRLCGVAVLTAARGALGDRVLHSHSQCAHWYGPL